MSRTTLLTAQEALGGSREFPQINARVSIIRAVTALFSFALKTLSLHLLLFQLSRHMSSRDYRAVQPSSRFAFSTAAQHSATSPGRQSVIS